MYSLPSPYNVALERNSVIERVREALELKDFVILDTETTGLERNDEIIQIGIIDPDGNTLLDTLIQTTRKSIPSASTAIHGITKKDLKDAPRWVHIRKKVESICEGKRVFIYNADFDTRLINQTCDNHSVPYLKLNTVCVMKLWSCIVGEWNDSKGNWKWQRLPDGDHSAIGDCIATLKVLHRIGSTELMPVPEPEPTESPEVENLRSTLQITGILIAIFIILSALSQCAKPTP